MPFKSPSLFYLHSSVARIGFIAVMILIQPLIPFSPSATFASAVDHAFGAKPNSDSAAQEGQQSSNQARISKGELDKLIDQLDAKEFSLRESASQKLSGIGEPAISPLAFKSFKCTPECCWRIKKTLESICVGGNETVFYKATGILQLRFDSDNAAMNQRLAGLKSKWRSQRKKEAIDELRKLGAKIVDPWEGLDQEAPQPNNLRWIGGGNVLILNGQVVEFNGSSGSVHSQPTRNDRKPLSESDQKKRINKILDSDLKQVRRLVLGDDGDSIGVDQSNQVATQIQNRMVMRAGLAGMGMPGAVGQAQGVTVELSDDWKGSDEDLENLAEISNLTQLILKGQAVSKKQVKLISAITTMSELILEDCRVNPKWITGAPWSPTLKEVEIANHTLSTGMIESFKSIPSIQLLTFRKCGFREVDFEDLASLTNLRGLQFKEVSVPTELLDVIAELKQLTYVNLTACKFKTKDYKSLKTKRPNLQITFTNQAFLGVRGPMDLLQSGDGDVPCEISEVIVGSGADKAGMKVDDVIQTVNGEKIEVFEDLRLHIAQHRPGETLHVVVQRAGKSVRLKVKLTNFDATNN